MRKNCSHCTTEDTGSSRGSVRGFRLRLKQMRILLWCSIVIAFLCGCMTGPMHQGLGSPILNMLREPYPKCESTIGSYMKAFKDKGHKIWSGSSNEFYQSRHIVPPAKDYTAPKQFIVLSKVQDLPIDPPKYYLPYVKGECDVTEFTVYFYIYVEYMPELEASR